MYNKRVFEQIVENLDLGEIIEEPSRVSGGLTHKMYKLITNKGKYIVKMLNPNIMKRSNAMVNFKRAEEYEDLLKENQIDSIYALEFNHKKMQKLEGNYFYLYDWYDGKSLKDNEITEEHCKLIGKVLANIHNITIKEDVWKESPKNIDWNYYVTIAKKQNSTIYDILQNNINLLYESMKKGNQVIDQLPQYSAICHNDLDSKNVLWINHEYKIIDLECLDKSNPYLELFIDALCWSGYESCKMNYGLLNAFIKSYFEESKIKIKINWEVLYAANNGRLEWLEYNIKRALLLETDSKEEQQLGIKEVQETMNHIIYYDSIKDELMNYFNH